MQQENQGKLSIQTAEKRTENPGWGSILGEKEYLYYGEAEEAFDACSWKMAEEISGQKIEESNIVLVKAWKRANDNWEPFKEEVLIFGR